MNKNEEGVWNLVIPKKNEGGFVSLGRVLEELKETNLKEY